MTFVSLAAMLAFLSSRPLWQKIIMVVTAVPIAIFCNVMRVSGQGLLDRYWSPEVSEGFAHQFVGLVMLIPAFFLILLVGWILQNLFIEELDDKEALPKRIVRATAQPAAVPAAAGAVKPQVLQRPAAAPRSPTAPAANRPAVIPPRPTGLAPNRPRKEAP